VTLVSGATSTNLLFKHFAYRELVDFASADGENSSVARTALFGNQKHNPSLWATLVRESLLLLSNDDQLLLRRGKPAPPIGSFRLAYTHNLTADSLSSARRRTGEAKAGHPIHATRAQEDIQVLRTLTR
jgi:hypothetical protein